MRSVADDTKNAALSAGRHIALAVEIATGLDGEYVTKQTLTDKGEIEYLKITIGGDNDGAAVGKTYCAQLTIKIPRYIDIAEKDRLIVRSYYDVGGKSTEKLSLGWFYVDKIEINGFIMTVTAYDAMLRTSKNYVPTIEFPDSMPNLLDDVLIQCGINLDSSVTVPNYTINTPPILGKDDEGNDLYYSRREILGYIGALMGGNWFLTSSRHLKLAKPAEPVDTVLAANVFESDINGNIFTITGIAWNNGKQTYKRKDVDASGLIEFYDPLDTNRETVMAALEMSLVGKSYYGGTIKRQGAGWHEIGDVVNVPIDKNGNTKPIMITGIERVFENGGYTETWQSYAQTESEANYTVDTPHQTETGGGDTFNDAIILTQGDLPYILHSYSVIEYRKDYNIIAQGPDSNIIIDGYIAYAQDAITANATKYTALTFSGSASTTAAPEPHVATAQIVESGRDSDGTPYNHVKIFDNGTQKGSVKSYGAFGLAIRFATIFAPNDLYMYGSAQVFIPLITTQKGGALYINNTAVYGGRMSFRNIDEYHAAIRLTKEPQAGGEVIETTITDDGNSTLEKAMLYTDKVAENLQNSFDNITAADREQITQNTSDIAAHDVRITALEGEVDDITAPAGGILSQSKNYTDYVADELRGEFGG